MRYFFLLSGLALVCASISCAAEREAHILEYGVYAPSIRHKIATTNSPTGYIFAGGTETLLQSTTNVAARVGVRFGFKYAIIGNPRGEKVSLRLLYQFPVLKNPVTGSETSQHEAFVDYELGTPNSYMVYGFDEKWEAVPGNWVFQVFEGKNKLLEQVFTVVDDKSDQDSQQ